MLHLIYNKKKQWYHLSTLICQSLRVDYVGTSGEKETLRSSDRSVYSVMGLSWITT